MNKYLASLIAGIFLSIISFAQNTQTGMHHGGNFSQTKDGTVSGTVIDSVSNKPIAGATIFLYNELRDSATQSIKEMLAGSAITKSDGSFEIGNVPTPARIRAQVSFIGYIAYNKTVMVSPRSNNTASIGNALMQQETGNLQTVNVTASQPFMQMGVDRKIFNVAQSLVSSGQTAQEVMAQIPSVSVDIDGNVSVRGASPQIYVDGMPTTLTLDQIPSDIIDKVELITNPSAKYDASSGGGGIINIVLKKNSTKGYNGGLNGGSDTRGAYNFGGDINMRLGKFNVFARANYRERNSTEKNHSQRDLYNNGIPTDTSIYQSGNSLRKGSFTFLNLGTDYNINKYNVITVSGNYVKGTFSGNQPQTVDSSFNGSPYSRSILGSNSNFEFKNFQGEVKYKHNFSEDGNHNILLDVNYNRATSNNYTAIGTGVYRNAPNFDALENDQLRNTKGNGGNKNWVFQADYTNPITENTKIEAGFRGQIRNTNSNSYQYLANSATEFPDGFDIIDPQYLNALGSSQYSYKDQVYAAYGTFSSKIGEKLSYELGGRIESSNYKGIYDSVPSLHAAPEFKVKYAAEFFPSAFVTYTFTQGEDLQANYSRKVNRPNFFQLLPVYNVS
ncbi:MAG TPA: TonB-dependent receptor, partial [Arachidicoccus sp.]